MRWALAFEGVILAGAVALGLSGSEWPVVALAGVGLVALALDMLEQEAIRQHAAGDVSKRVATLEQQVDRLNKANAFKGL